MTNSLLTTLADAARYLPARAVSVTTSIVTVVALTRLMGPSEYGVYVVLLTSGALLSTCAFNWLTAAAFRFCEDARRAADLGGLYRDLLVCYAAMAGGWLLAGAVAVVVVARGVVAVSAAGVVGLVALGLLDPLLALYQNVRMSSRDVRRWSMVAVTDGVLRAGFGVAGAALLTDAVAGMLGGQALAAVGVVGWIAVRERELVRVEWRAVDWRRIRRFAAYGFPMAGASVASWALSVSDRLLVSWLLGASAVGLYAVGYQVASNAVLIPASIVMAGAFPVLIQQHAREGRAAAAQLLGALVSGVLVAGGALVVFLTIASPGLVHLLLGSAYAEAAVVIPVIAVGQLLMTLTEHFAKSFQLSGRTLTLFLVTLGAAAVNVAANVVLVPWAGLRGAAAATVLAAAASVFTTAALGARLLTIPFPFGSLWRVAVAAAACLVPLSFRPASPEAPVISGLMGLTGVLVFVATLWMTGEPTVRAAARLVGGGSRLQAH